MKRSPSLGPTIQSRPDFCPACDGRRIVKRGLRKNSFRRRSNLRRYVEAGAHHITEAVTLFECPVGQQGQRDAADDDPPCEYASDAGGLAGGLPACGWQSMDRRHYREHRQRICRERSLVLQAYATKKILETRIRTQALEYQVRA